MPQSQLPEAREFADKYLDKQLFVRTTNGFAFLGNLIALEYDRSIMLRDLKQFIKTDDSAVDFPTAESHPGWEMIARKEILLPGKLVAQVLFQAEQ